MLITQASNQSSHPHQQRTEKIMTKEIDEAIEVFKEIASNPDGNHKEELTQKDNYNAFCDVYQDLILKALEAYKASQPITKEMRIAELTKMLNEHGIKVEAVKPDSQWLPIEDAPMDGSDVFCMNKKWLLPMFLNYFGEDYFEKEYGDAEYMESGWYLSQSTDFDQPDEYTREPTHYMPIPKFEEE